MRFEYLAFGHSPIYAKSIVFQDQNQIDLMRRDVAMLFIESLKKRFLSKKTDFSIP